jgi:patatin-like phospholipase/acyl hydrolase
MARPPNLADLETEVQDIITRISMAETYKSPYDFIEARRRLALIPGKIRALVDHEVGRAVEKLLLERVDQSQ